jgi:hypothetical protein
METIHTHYIKKLSDDTGRTYRELESLWSKFKNEIENDRLYDPNKYSHLSKSNGGIAQEIDKKLRAYIENPEGVEQEEITDETNAVDENEYANEIQLGLEEPSMYEEGDIANPFADIDAENADVETADEFADLFPNNEEEVAPEEAPEEANKPQE